MMNMQNAINEIHALVANSEVNDAVAERLLTIAYYLEAACESCSVTVELIRAQNRKENWNEETNQPRATTSG